MQKTYNKFNLFSLLAIILIVLSIPAFSDYNNKIVTFKDSGLEKAVRDHIGKEEGAIYLSDVDTIEILNANNYKIKNLEGIENLVNLLELHLENNFVKSVTPLKNNMRLRVLNLAKNEITDLKELGIQNILFLHIRGLNLRDNVKIDKDGKEIRIKDISLLGQMIALRRLDLRANHVEDLTPLSNLRRLTKLDLRDNKFDNIDALRTLTRLEKLNIRGNHITSLEPIKYLHRLEYLNIHSIEGLEDLSPIDDLHNLETLIMRNVQVSDNKFLEGKTKLQRLNAIDTGLTELDNTKIIEDILNAGGLQGDVRPYRLVNTLEKPIVNKESGFYKEKFFLEVSTKGDTYYTLDGSEPTHDSPRYTQPIEIEERDNNSATVVRFKTIENNLSSETVSKTYFVNNRIDERFTLSIFSIITDPANLFDPAIGIYHENNYMSKGMDWERPIDLEFFNDQGEMEFSQAVGIRIHGGITRAYAQKSFRIISNLNYSEDGFFDHDFFDTEITRYNTLILRNGGNDWDAGMFNDAMIQTLVSDIGTFPTQDYLPSVVFINGEYYGIYNLRERYDAQYFYNHFQMEKDEIAVLKKNQVISLGTVNAKEDYAEMLSYLRKYDVKEDKHFEYIKTQMDIESFIDYFASQIFFSVDDWPHNNIRYWKKTANFNDQYGHDGRWRWAMYDTDHGFGRYTRVDDDGQHFGLEHDTFSWVMAEFDGIKHNREWPNFLFRNLMKNQAFQNEFLNRLNDLINTTFSYDVIEETMDHITGRIKFEIHYHENRWGKFESYQNWEKTVANRKEFAYGRPDVIRRYVKDYLMLDSLNEIQLQNENDGGHVQINRIHINADLPGNTNLSENWKGEYFSGIPITLKAHPNEGFEFSHWLGIEENQTAAEVTVIPNQSMEIEAVFVEIEG